ncbi:MAG: GEVED domain-containing protein, partial [Fusobacteriaceae bacterium]
MGLKYKSWLRNIILIITLFLTGIVSAAAEFDYGDAPDGSRTGGKNYLYKTIDSSAARHTKVEGSVRFGDKLDYETDESNSGYIKYYKDRGLEANEAADADDTYLGSDDEDGIVAVNGIPYTGGVIPFIEGQRNTMTIKVSNAPIAGANAVIWLDGKDGTINYQFDNNSDGQIFDQNTNTKKVFNGETTFGFDLINIGNRNTTQGRTYMRMRISTDAINGNGGDEPDGEVEDYQVFISEKKTDYGDLPNTYKTTLVADGARHLDVFLFGQTTPLGGLLKIGANKDYEVDANSPLDGTGDDVIGSPDDEDGVQFFAGTSTTAGTIIYSNSENTMKVTTTGSGTLSVFLDKNGNKSFEDESERIHFASVSGTGTVTTITIPTGITIPSDGKVGVRVRFASDGTQVAKSYGQANSGEVEDYYIDVALTPNITVLKTADKTNAKPGEIVNYKIKLENLSTIPFVGYVVKDNLLKSNGILPVAVSDLKIGGIAATAAQKLALFGDGTIDPVGLIVDVPAADLEITYTLTIPADYTKATIVNTANGSTVTVVVPSVTVLKTADKTNAKLGETVNYAINLTNPTTATFVGYVLKDNLLESNGILVGAVSNLKIGGV